MVAHQQEPSVLGHFLHTVLFNKNLQHRQGGLDVQVGNFPVQGIVILLGNALVHPAAQKQQEQKSQQHQQQQTAQGRHRQQPQPGHTCKCAAKPANTDTNNQRKGGKCTQKHTYSSKA